MLTYSGANVPGFVFLFMFGIGTQLMSELE